MWGGGDNILKFDINNKSLIRQIEKQKEKINSNKLTKKDEDLRLYSSMRGNINNFRESQNKITEELNEISKDAISMFNDLNINRNTYLTGKNHN